MYWKFPKKTTQYIFFEMLPAFFIGLIVFIFILLMFQALRLTDFVLVHGVGLGTIIDMIVYMSVSFLPALFPMSLLFSVLMTYGRLSQDSEIVALKASGFSLLSIGSPAIVLGGAIAFVSAQTSFHLAPWGNRQFEILIAKLSQSKAAATIREGTFSEGFFDLVIYANSVDSKKGNLEKVFIFDERQNPPLAIIAKQGNLVPDPNNPGSSVLLRLNNGDIHRNSEAQTKIKFDLFDIYLNDPVKEEKRNKSSQSMSLEEIENKIIDPQTNRDDLATYKSEWHKRWAISIVCIIFASLGVGMGTTADRRNRKSNGLVLSLGIVIGYWTLYVAAEGLARSGNYPAGILIWFPNFLFCLFSIWQLKKAWN